MSQLINIFLEPAKVFAELKERPTFLVPMLLVVLSMLGALGLYFVNVDPEWFVEHQMTQAQLANPEIARSQLEAARQFMTPAFAGTASVIVIGVFVLVMYVLMTLYYWLAGRIAGVAIGFRHALALTAWPLMPLLVSSLLIVIGVFTSSAQTPLEDLQMLNVHPLLVQVPVDSPWAGLARSFSLLNLWCWFLAALGWKIWGRGSWGGAVFVAVLPSLLIFGGWALFAAI